MSTKLALCMLAVVLTVCPCLPAGAQEAVVDGVPYSGGEAVATVPAPADSYPSGEAKAQVVDVVGDTSNAGSGTGLAKGNAYRIDTGTGLVEAEFWLDFSGSQTLAFYLYHSPTEFGAYTQVFTTSGVVAGSGPGWYSSGPINYWMDAGNYYIVAVSWDGTTGYAYGTGDSQATSFGAQVYGYATGTHPLPTVFNTSANDQAIYYQRLTTDVEVPVQLQRFEAE